VRPDGPPPVDRVVTLTFRRRTLAARAHLEGARGAALDGVGMRPGSIPLEIVGRSRVEGLRLAQVATYHDPRGRYRPRPLSGSEARLAVDTVVAAVGREPEADWIGASHLVPDGGTVIDAVAAGQRMAARVDRELTGGEERRRPFVSLRGPCAMAQPLPRRARREATPEVTGPGRLRRRLVEPGLAPQAAVREGARCLDCRVSVLSERTDEALRCALCGRCVEGCPASALRLETVEMGMALLYDAGSCLRCGLCVERCPAGCLTAGELAEEVVGGHG